MSCIIPLTPSITSAYNTDLVEHESITCAYNTDLVEHELGVLLAVVVVSHLVESGHAKTLP